MTSDEPHVPAPRRESGRDREAAAPAEAQPPRPILERIGMAVIALVLASLFAVVAVAAFIGGEPFLGVMGAVGCLMVLWVGSLTLFRGR
jgi:hypothetical protein